MLGLKHKESLESALKDIDKGREYQAMDIINKHIKEVIESTKPNVENALKKLEKYLDDMQQSLILLDQSTKASKEIEPQLIKDAQEKIRDAMKQLEGIDDCCQIMKKSRNVLE